MTERATLFTVLCIAACCTLPGSVLVAQAPAQYLVQHDTVRYELVNPFRMYWARGTDTIGDRVRGASVESHVWSGTDKSPIVQVAVQNLSVNRIPETSAYSIAPSGKVMLIDGKPPKPGSRADLLPRLPLVPLRIGARWSDTTATSGDAGAVGEELDEAVRTYEVARLFDTLGTRAAEIHAVGTWHMRSSFWVDSTNGRSAWLDVRGPMDEHDLFDVSHGRLLQRAWKMDLRGRGVAPTGAADTIAAGLFSEEVMRVSDSPRTRFLLRALPGSDTAVTVDMTRNAPILLHTVARDASAITASLTRNDGMVGVAHVQFDGAVVRTYDATWADSGETLVTQYVSRDGAQLVVHRSGKPDDKLSIPEGAWGIADYAMEELLAPTLLAVPRDGASHPFAVYRPYPGHWDSVTVKVTPRADALVCVLTMGKDAPEIIVLTTAGDYLYGENSGPTSARRFPLGAARREQLRALFASKNPGT
jgi:hypothetical protein